MNAPIVTCPNCGKRNRLRASSEGTPRCGACHRPIPWIVDADDGSFDAEIAAAVPVLVDLWAPWCGPCKWVAPAVEQAAADHAGALKVVRVDIDQAPAIARRFEVVGIPTLVLMRDGAEVDRLSGAPEKPALLAWIADRLRATPTAGG